MNDVTQPGEKDLPQQAVNATLVPKRKRKWTLIVGVGLAAALVVGGGVWLGNDLSKRRTVPDLSGATLSEAKKLVEQVDLGLAFDSDSDAAKLKDGNTLIIEQSPAAGESAYEDSGVKVVVAGRDLAVPNLKGLTFGEAVEAVSAAEFNLAHQFGARVPPDSWKVADQAERAGSKAAAGSALEIELEVPEIVVPDLAGSELVAGSKALSDLSLFPEKEGLGSHIVSTSIEAGTKVEPFSSLTMKLGYAVPDLVGKTQAEAKAMLSNFKNVKTVGLSSRAIATQSIPAGNIVDPETEILLTSPGPETVYRVFGNGSSASITWVRPGSFDIQQALDASLPWEMRFNVESGTALFSAQMMDGDSITCQLERNGKVVKELTSTGPYAIVQC